MQLTESEVYEIIKEEVRKYLEETKTTRPQGHWGFATNVHTPIHMGGPRVGSKPKPAVADPLARPASKFSRKMPWTDPSAGWVEPLTGDYHPGDPSGAGAPGRSYGAQRSGRSKKKKMGQERIDRSRLQAKIRRRHQAAPEMVAIKPKPRGRRIARAKDQPGRVH